MVYLLKRFTIANVNVTGWQQMQKSNINIDLSADRQKYMSITKPLRDFSNFYHRRNVRLSDFRFYSDYECILEDIYCLISALVWMTFFQSVCLDCIVCDVWNRLKIYTHEKRHKNKKSTHTQTNEQKQKQDKTKINGKNEKHEITK
jgi:hypothetical protein